MIIFPLAPDQTIAQMWSNGARGLRWTWYLRWSLNSLKHEANIQHYDTSTFSDRSFAAAGLSTKRAAVQPTRHWAITDYFQPTSENVLILRRVLRPRRICDIYDLFAPCINLLTSATPFQFIFIIDCQPQPTPHRRWPSFPGRRCTCLEQSAWSCHFRTVRSSLPVPA